MSDRWLKAVRRRKGSGRIRTGWGVGLAAALTLAATGCGGRSDSAPSTTVDVAFLEGRSMVNIYEEAPPDGFVESEFLEHLAGVLGLSQDDVALEYYSLRRENDGRVIVHSTSPDGTREKIIFSILTGQWRMAPEKYHEPEGDFCAACAPVSISEQEALERSKALFAEVGVDVDAVAWRATTKPTGGKGDYETVLVAGSPMVEGQPFSSGGTQFEVEWGDGAEIVHVAGLAYVPRVVKEAGLLSPQEALAQLTKNPAEAMALEGADIDDAELVWEIWFDRSTQVSWAVPQYRFQWAGVDGEAIEEFATSSALAVRTQDLPSGPVYERKLKQPDK